MPTRKTLRGWWDYLDDPKRELTLEEFVAVMSMNAREYARLALESVASSRQAIEHVESMVGTLDAVMAMRDPLYGELGAKRGEMVPALGRPVPASNGNAPRPDHG
jgi:hypothetical protein